MDNCFELYLAMNNGRIRISYSAVLNSLLNIRTVFQHLLNRQLRNLVTCLAQNNLTMTLHHSTAFQGIVARDALSLIKRLTLNTYTPKSRISLILQSTR